MEKALIDTDIWFDILRGVRPKVMEYADDYLATHGNFTISAMTVAEFIRGIVRRHNPRILQKWQEQMQSLEIIPVDAAVAELTGTILARLDDLGTPIGSIDPFVAATAIVHERVLVTANTRHYQRIIDAGFALRMANWRE